jgi:hypothetical protein
VAVSAGCRDHLQRWSGTFTIESRVSFVLRQLLIGRVPVPQLVAQLPRVLSALSKFPHLKEKPATRCKQIVYSISFHLYLLTEKVMASRRRFLRLSGRQDFSDPYNPCRLPGSRRSFLVVASKSRLRVDARPHNDGFWVVACPCKTRHSRDPIPSLADSV